MLSVRLDDQINDRMIPEVDQALWEQLENGIYGYAICEMVEVGVEYPTYIKIHDEIQREINDQLEEDYGGRIR